MNDWHELTDLTGDRRFQVTEVRLETGISIQGEFELPPLARLRYEDQVFVSEFVRSHGSIKDMEKAFGVSYPTVKNRLNRIVDQLQLVEVGVSSSPAPDDALGPARARRDLGRRGGREAPAMNIPPAILDLRVRPSDGRRVHLWLPLFLLWPFALALGILALVLTILVDFVLIVLGKRYHHYTILLARSFGALCETRGMVIRVNDGKTAIDMTIQ